MLGGAKIILASGKIILGGAKIILASPKRGPERQGDLKQERHRQDRQMTGEGKSKHYKQVSHGATLIFDDVFSLHLNLIFHYILCPKSYWPALMLSIKFCRK